MYLSTIEIIMFFELFVLYCFLILQLFFSNNNSIVIKRYLAESKTEKEQKL